MVTIKPYSFFLPERLGVGVPSVQVRCEDSDVAASTAVRAFKVFESNKGRSRGNSIFSQTYEVPREDGAYFGEQIIATLQGDVSEGIARAAWVSAKPGEPASLKRGIMLRARMVDEYVQVTLESPGFLVPTFSDGLRLLWYVDPVDMESMLECKITGGLDYLTARMLSLKKRVLPVRAH